MRGAHTGVADADATALRIGPHIDLDVGARRIVLDRVVQQIAQSQCQQDGPPGDRHGGMGGRGLQGQVLAAFVGGLGVVGHSLAAQVIQAHRLHLQPCLALCAGKSQQLGQYFACMQCLRLHGVQGLGPLYRVGAGSGHMALQGQ